MSRLQREGAEVAWFTEPAELVPGQCARLLYNVRAGPLGFMSPLPSAPAVIIGHNGWLDSQVGTCDMQMSRPGPKF